MPRRRRLGPRADNPRSCAVYYSDAGEHEVYLDAAQRDVGKLCAHGGTLAIHLGIRNLREIERVLTPHYGADCPVVVAYRVGWPDQMFVKGTISDIQPKIRAAKITRTALILVGPALREVQDFRDSALYDPAMPHVLRPKARA